jgi:hypothetical protein
MEPFTFIGLIISFAVSVFVWTCLLRLAARMLSIARAGWLYALQCSVALVSVSTLLSFALPTIGLDALHAAVPFVVSYIVAVTTIAWFFRRRGLRADGTPLGWVGGTKFGLAASVFSLVLLGAVVATLRLGLIALARI